MSFFVRLSLALCCLLFAFTPAALAADKSDKPADDQPKFKPLSELTEGMEEVTASGGERGMLTLYRYPADARHEDGSKLLARIPKSLIGKDLLVGASITRGLSAGFMWGDSLARFTLRGQSVVLEAPNVRYVLEEGSPLGASVERTYRPRILGVMPIETMVGADPVVDLADLLMAYTGRLPGTRATRPARKLSEYALIQVFPDNVLIDMDLAMKDGESYELVGLAYSLRRLPSPAGFTPRPADERVGYFHSAQQDWHAEPDAKETVQRFINRWRLNQADASLDRSPPEQPILFIIEDTVPIRWRPWVKAGILAWNPAFEALGFADAIEVRQQSEHNLYADVEPADARYNFVQWAAMGRPFGFGPRRVDPRTGEILDADIVIDHSFLRAYHFDLEIVSKQTGEDRLGQPMRRPTSALAAVEERERPTGQHADLAAGQATHNLARHHHHTCNHMPGLVDELRLLQAKADGHNGLIPEHLLGQLIQKVVTHEVGHALGLRHNFKASAWLSLPEIKRRRDHTDLPTTASVMDYAPVLFFAGDDVNELRHITDPVIGPYDHWAIEYGYRPASGGKAQDEMLQQIAARSAEPALAYATDEDTHLLYRPDPYTARFDLGDDPIAWAQSRLKLTDDLLKTLDEWAVAADEPTHYRRSIFNAVLRQRYSGMPEVAKLVTGQIFSRSRLSDPDAPPPFTMLPRRTRLDAIDFLSGTVFQSESFPLSPEQLNRLAPVRWKDWATRRVNRLDYPVHDFVLNAQTTPLVAMLHPAALERQYDAAYKTEPDQQFPVTELLDRLTQAIWAELEAPPADRAPGELIDSLRRNLQNQHIDLLQNYAEPGRRYYAAADLHRQTRFELRQLAERIRRYLDAHRNDLDRATLAHLVEAASRIDRALEAEYIAR